MSEIGFDKVLVEFCIMFPNSQPNYGKSGRCDAAANRIDFRPSYHTDATRTLRNVAENVSDAQ